MCPELAIMLGRSGFELFKNLALEDFFRTEFSITTSLKLLPGKKTHRLKQQTKKVAQKLTFSKPLTAKKIEKNVDGGQQQQNINIRT